MSDNVKRIDIKEFRQKGYLQELNRVFLHPLGLALEIIQEENGDEKLGGVWDYREDTEGIYFDLANSPKERQHDFKNKANYIKSQFDKRWADREKVLGFDIEPVH